jgi:hypothetical protein
MVTRLQHANFDAFLHSSPGILPNAEITHEFMRFAAPFKRKQVFS